MSKTYPLTELQKSLIERLEAAGFTARWWGPGDQAERVYLNTGRRDAKVFLSFDNARDCSGSALKVSIDECGQAPAWYRSQRQKLAQRFAPASMIAMSLTETPEELARRQAEWDATPEAKRCDMV